MLNSTGLNPLASVVFSYAIYQQKEIRIIIIIKLVLIIHTQLDFRQPFKSKFIATKDPHIKWQ